jgi:hypothetical protein
MKVRCLRIASPATGEELDKSSWLTVGREYVVLQIVALPGREVLLRLEGDKPGSPGLWESSLFETVDTGIPASWSAHVDEDGNLSIGPDAWRRQGFWDDFFDDDPEAVREYHALAELARSAN